MSRRGRNEGAVYRRADGQWCGALTVGYDENGKRRRRTVYGRTNTEVLEKMQKVRTALVGGVLPDAIWLTLAEFMKRWVDDGMRQSVRPRTYQTCKWLIDKHLNPRIGGVRLDNLSPLHVQELLATMERDGCSPRLRQMVLQRLSKALKQAVRWTPVARNPCDAVDKPKAPKKEFTVLDQEQMKIFLGAAKAEGLYALYAVAVTTGLRQGELLGLRWQDVDLKAGTLAVRQILQEDNPTGEISFHDLRHTAATLLLAAGVHPRVVQERLGYASIVLTLDTYSHVLPSMQKEATEKLNRLLG